MSVSLQSGSRPPYVVFEVRALEDRNATIAKGCRIDRDVDFVIIRQVGSKDTAEMEAKVWLETLDKDPNMQPEWVDKFKDAYQRWKAGQEPAVDGVPVSQWPAINKAQASLLLAAQIRTVEDLAAANEAALARVGIGARELQNKAKEFLRVANDTGKAAEELAVLRARAAGQDETIATLRQQLAALAAKVDGMTAHNEDQAVARALAASSSPNFM